MKDLRPKAMISQPMGGLSDQEIQIVRNQAIGNLRTMGYQVVDTWFAEYQDTEHGNVPLFCLAKSLEAMSDVDLVYFVRGWRKARGCRIEYKAAKAYGIPCMKE